MFLSRTAYLLTLCLNVAALGFTTPAPAANDELSSTLGLVDDATAASGHIPRPISKIAENVTVISAEEIARINAHTLADVLQTVPGIQLDQVQSPGSSVFLTLYNYQNWHVLVVVDGVSQNFLSSNSSAQVGAIPARRIERVEIIKGPASTSWGSALGGVINVITKSAAAGQATGATAGVSAGERGTADAGAELTGTVNRFGYYLGGGKLRSDGVTSGNRTDLDHLIANLSCQLPNNGSVTLNLDYRNSAFGLEDVPAYDYHDTGSNRFASSALSLVLPLADRLSLAVAGQIGRREQGTVWGNLSTPELSRDKFNYDYSSKERFDGASVRLNWGDARTNLSTGVEFKHNGLKARESIWRAPESNFDKTLDGAAAYLNGSWSFGPVTLLPGLRVDDYSIYGKAATYSLGAVSSLTETTIVRAYTASGYGLPTVTNVALVSGSKRLAKILTVQGGVETTAVPYLWLKGTGYYSEVRDIEDLSTQPIVLRRQELQGVEVEAKTTPFFGVQLAGGYTFTRTRDKELGELKTGSFQSCPPHAAKLALNYDHPAGTKGAVVGNYVWWNQVDGADGRDRTFIWDLHLTRKLPETATVSSELFFSAHNIFNGSQYQIGMRANAPRWFEAGMRFHF